MLEGILPGNTDERLRFIRWKTPSDLRGVLDATLLYELSLDKDAQQKSLAVALGGSSQGDYVYFKEGGETLLGPVPRHDQPTPGVFSL